MTYVRLNILMLDVPNIILFFWKCNAMDNSPTTIAFVSFSWLKSKITLCSLLAYSKSPFEENKQGWTRLHFELLNILECIFTGYMSSSCLLCSSFVQDNIVATTATVINTLIYMQYIYIYIFIIFLMSAALTKFDICTLKCQDGRTMVFW